MGKNYFDKMSENHQYFMRIKRYVQKPTSESFLLIQK